MGATKITVQPEGNYYNKYSSKNPIERCLMTGFFSRITKLLKDRVLIGPEGKILEAGCGEGHFTEFLRGIYPNVGIDAFDISEKCILEAGESYKDKNINFSTGNICDIRYEADTFNLTVASEVLEHMEEPRDALNELARVSSEYVLITIPNEPLWRILNMCRFKYLKDFGNTPGHVQHWNRKKFLKFAADIKGLKPVKYTKALPWLIFLFKKEI